MSSVTSPLRSKALFPLTIAARDKVWFVVSRAPKGETKALEKVLQAVYSIAEAAILDALPESALVYRGLLGRIAVLAEIFTWRANYGTFGKRASGSLMTSC